MTETPYEPEGVGLEITIAVVIVFALLYLCVGLPLGVIFHIDWLTA